MSNIIKDFEKKRYKIRAYIGSYSIVSSKNSSMMKVLCAIDSDYRIPVVSIGIFFRKEFINNKGLENIDIFFQV